MEEKGFKDNKDKLQFATVLKKQFPLAIKEVVKRSTLGHIKYIDTDKDFQNFTRIPDAENSFEDALLRHLFLEGEDTELEHYTAVAWNALALLELKLRNYYGK